MPIAVWINAALKKGTCNPRERPLRCVGQPFRVFCAGPPEVSRQGAGMHLDGREALLPIKRRQLPW